MGKLQGKKRRAVPALYLAPDRNPGFFMTQSNPLLSRLEELNAIGISLSSERDTNRLLETILVAAKRITNADAGTLYLVEPEQQLLRFEIMRTDSLGIAMGGTTGSPVPFYPIHLVDKDGQPNHKMGRVEAAAELIQQSTMI